MARGRYVGITVGLAIALSVTRAEASLNYPEAIQDHLGLTMLPECTLCHATELGGDGTVDEPFGLTANMLGAGGDNDTSSLIVALNQMQSRNTNSDGDFVGDVAELRAGTDPNVYDASPGAGGAAGDAGGPPIPVPAPPGGDLPEPQTGCSTSGTSPSDAAVLLLALLFSAFAARIASRAAAVSNHGSP